MGLGIGSRLTPQDSSAPDSTADHALSLLREASSPDARAAINALDPLLEDDYALSPAEARTTIDGLLTLIAALPNAELSSEPATLINDQQAVKVYTLTPRANQDAKDPAAPPAPAHRFAMTLALAPAGNWRFRALTRLDTG
ncbi:MAG TPA: hypothetical protein PLU35_09115 [Phycisphaerales bacterium]|nr:hypothetical protein [Phycisphaerales bacterium]